MFKAENYNDAVLYLGKKTDRPYGAGRATRVVKTDSGVGIKYHRTVVVEYTEAGIVLNTGGWSTVTTKERMNTALSNLDCGMHISVFQDHGVWYVNANRRNPKYVDPFVEDLNPLFDPGKPTANYHRDGADSNWDMRYIPNPNGDRSEPYMISVYRFVFFDGITIGYDGKVINPPAESDDTANLEENKRRQKLIKKFVTTLRKQLTDESLPAPSAGDCWYCSMRDVESGVPLGELTESDHLLHHIEECYIVPSLIWRILELSGSVFVRSALWNMWNPENSRPVSDWEKGIMIRDTCSATRRYLRSRLGIGN